MKLIHLFIFLLCSLSLNGQGKVNIGIYQDIKLAVIGDERGNEALTTDLKITVGLQGKRTKYGYFELRPEFEYAELKGGKFVLWNVNAGFVFDDIFIENLSLGTYAGAGFIHRWNSGYLNYAFLSDLSYGKKIKVSILLQMLKRSDIEDKWGSRGFKPSVFGGVKLFFRL